MMMNEDKSMEEKNRQALSHEVIKDLLILYVNGDCSEDSRKLIDEHIRECEECRDYLHDLMADEPFVRAKDCGSSYEKTAETNEKPEEEQLLRRGLKKIRRRWAASVIAAACLLPAAILGIIARNEYIGQGIAFTNMDDILHCSNYWKQLCGENPEKALQKEDWHTDYDSIMKALETKAEGSEVWAGTGDYNDYVQDQKQVLASWYREYREMGYRLSVDGFSDAYRTYEGWVVSFLMEETAPNGSVLSFVADLLWTENGLRKSGSRVISSTSTDDTVNPVFIMLDIAYYWEKRYHTGLAGYLAYLEESTADNRIRVPFHGYEE